VTGLEARPRFPWRSRPGELARSAGPWSEVAARVVVGEERGELGGDARRVRRVDERVGAADDLGKARVVAREHGRAARLASYRAAAESP
jgi:hypothetical protein